MQRRQRQPNGAPHPHLRLQNGVRKTHYRRYPVFPLRQDGQEGQISRSDYRKARGEHARGCWMRPCDYHGPSRESDSGVLRYPCRQLVVRALDAVVYQTANYGLGRRYHRQSRCWRCKAVRDSTVLRLGRRLLVCVVRTTAIADKLGVDFALIHRKRDGKAEDAPEKMEILVGDVKGKVRQLHLMTGVSPANVAHCHRSPFW